MKIDLKKMKKNIGNLEQFLNENQKSYSKQLMDLLKSMLHPDPK